MYQLFIPCFYTENPTATGPALPRPDTSLLAYPHNGILCRRFRLPTRIGDLKFTFPVSSATGEQIRNFYHLGDCFLVSEDARRLFAAHFNDDLETHRVMMHHADGRPSATPYWAIFIRRIVDCIDPAASFAETAVCSNDDVAFTQLRFSMPLSQEYEHDFANEENGIYCSYPDWQRTRILALRPGALPKGLAIVQPRLWPGCWLIETDFASILQATSANGNYDGYYFWTLELDSISEGYRETLRALR